MTGPLFVVKVGGSLLDWPELPHCLTEWLRHRPAGLHLLVAGGGALCDAIRHWDSMVHLGEERAHWLCIDALSISAQFLSQLLGDLPIVDSLEKARRQHQQKVTTVVFDPRLFLRIAELELPGPRLPHTWDATTDSIAARLASCLAADELVLVKSCDPPALDVASLCEAGYVDPFFVVACRNVRQVACVNLRRGGPPIVLEQGSQ